MFVPFQSGGQDYSKDIKLGYSFNISIVLFKSWINYLFSWSMENHVLGFLNI